jgi:hypothetical protein
LQELFADSLTAYVAELRTALTKGYDACREQFEPAKLVLAAAAASSGLPNALMKQAALQGELTATQQLLTETQQHASASAAAQRFGDAEQYERTCFSERLAL